MKIKTILAATAVLVLATAALGVSAARAAEPVSGWLVQAVSPPANVNYDYTMAADLDWVVISDFGTDTGGHVTSLGIQIYPRDADGLVSTSPSQSFTYDTGEDGCAAAVPDSIVVNGNSLFVKLTSGCNTGVPDALVIYHLNATSGQWTQSQSIAQVANGMGASNSLAFDGTTLYAAPALNQGAITTFQNIEGDWGKVGYLAFTNPSASGASELAWYNGQLAAEFGGGNYQGWNQGVVVFAPGAGTVGLVQQAVLVPPDADPSNVSINENNVAIGEGVVALSDMINHTDPTNPTSPPSYELQIFAQTNGVWAWSQTFTGHPSNFFAIAGDRMLVGDGAGTFSGDPAGAYLYTRSGPGAEWTLAHTFKDPNALPDPESGYNVLAYGGGVNLVGNQAIVQTAYSTPLTGDTYFPGALYIYTPAMLSLAMSAPASAPVNKDYSAQVMATNAGTTPIPDVALMIPSASNAVVKAAKLVDSTGTCTIADSHSRASCDITDLAPGAEATVNLTYTAGAQAGKVHATTSVSGADPAMEASASTNLTGGSSGGGGGGGGTGGGGSGNDSGSSGGGGGAFGGLGLGLLGLLLIPAAIRRRGM